MFQRLFFAASILSACSPAPSPAPPVAPQSASPAMPPSPVVATAAPRPTLPGNRLAFELASRGDQKVRASLEVPEAYGIAMDDGGAVIATCHASSGVGGEELKGFWMAMRGVTLKARACESGDAKACIRTALGDAEAKGDLEWKGDVFARRDAVAKHKDGSARYEGGAAAYDAESKAVVICSYALGEEVARYRAEYLRMCDSLALGPDPSMGKAEARNATLADAEREELSEVSDKAKLRRVVEGFVTSMGQGDHARARTFMLQPADCNKLAGSDPAKAKECKEDVAKVMAMLPKLGVPSKIEVAGMRIAQGDGVVHRQPRQARAENEQKGLYEVMVMPKGSECAAEIPIFVMVLGGDYRVFLPLKKEPRRK